MVDILSDQNSPYLQITTTEALAALTERFCHHAWFAIDTEFERERTYFPNLCLIQVATVEETALIDPLSPDIDLQCFFDLLSRPDVTKVFHAGRQDIEIFYHLTGKLPAPVFDSQIAAMVCGMGEAVGYEHLVRRRLGIAIDKSFQVTNWALRPLSEAQKAYAAADATHLATLYPALYEEVVSQGRQAWIADELARLNQPSTFEVKPEAAWQKVKGRVKGQQQFEALVKLAAWREETAKRRNKPRQRILRDANLVDMANQRPKSHDDLKRLRGSSAGIANSRDCQAMLDAIHQEAPFPIPERTTHHKTNVEGHSSLIDIVKLLLKQVSEAEGVAGKLVATNHEIEKLVQGNISDSPLLTGWRADIFGHKAKALLEGKLTLSIKNNKIMFTRTQDC